MAWLSTRMSTYQMNYFLRGTVSDTSLALQRAGQELSTGRRSDIFGDLGPRASVAISMRAREEDTQAYLASNKVLENKLQTMLNGIETMRDPVDGVLQNVVLNLQEPNLGASALQTQAQSALDALIGTLNTSYNGEYIFAGTNSQTQPMTAWREADAGTGLSPQSIIASIVGSGPSDAATALAMSAELDQVLSSTHPTTNFNFEESFYNGTPELDASSQPNERITGRLDQGQQLHYGVQGNDQAFRDTIKGLAMLAAVDVDTITDQDAYRAYMDEAFKALGSGSQGLLDISSDVGFNQQLVEDAKDRLEDLSIVQTKQIGEYENVDPYEVATRMTSLETQLQASYSVASRLSGLTILDWYR